LIAVTPPALSAATPVNASAVVLAAISAAAPEAVRAAPLFERRAASRLVLPVTVFNIIAGRSS
jgi:hypothetical protein